MSKYLSVHIYAPKGFPDCSNDGVSRRNETLYIECPDGNWKEGEIPDERKLIINKNRHGYVSCRPLLLKDRRPMMGGTFVYTSDSRFRQHISERPLPLHDRLED